MDNTLKEAASALMKDPAQRQALAELIFEYVNPGHVTSDWIGLLFNTRNLRPGDALVKKVRKGIKVYSHVPGAIPLSSEVTVSDRINYVLDMAVVSVHMSEWDLRNGELGTLESIRAEMQAKLRDYYMAKVFTALSTIWNATNTPDNYTAVGSEVTKTALDAMIERINQTTMGAKAIVGTRSALQPITDFAQWADSSSTAGNLIQEVAMEVFKTGWLGQYRGVPLVVVNRDVNNPEDERVLVPTDKVLVVGENVGEFITYGDVSMEQWTDPKPLPPEFYLRMSQQFGFIVDNADGIGVLKIS